MDGVSHAPAALGIGEARRVSGVALVGVGLAAGLLGGLFGAGTTVLVTLSLVGLLGFTQHRAQGTAVSVGLPTAAVAAATYARHGYVSWEIALPAIVGSVLFAAVGATFVTRISAARLQVMFFFLILFAAYRLWVS
jgi:uncharacterized membrane protein YfcA